MRLFFDKPADGTHLTRVIRPDGIALEVRGVTQVRAIPHDLAHFVVENRLKLRSGFWGCVAAGAFFPSMRLLSGRKPPHSDERSRAIIKDAGPRLTEAEVLVSLALDFAHRNLDADWRQVQARIDDAWVPSSSVVARLTPESIRLTCDALRHYRDRWQALPTGESLTADWPDPPPPSTLQPRSARLLPRP